MPRKKIITSRQSLQIIGGTYRHRTVDFVAVDNLRPTGARLRETLFNWLQGDLHDAHCLDLFAGSGVLGFEAVSRGAKSVTFVEKNRQAAMCLRDNVSRLGIPNAEVLHADYRQVPEKKYDIIFLDPPYQLCLLPELLGFIEPFSPQWVFVEDENSLDWVVDKCGYELRRNKKAGNIYYGLLCKKTV